MTGPTDKPEGILLVDKPSGMTSHDVIDRIRKLVGIRRVGHTGTLDPMAEGLLVVCIGSATRVVQFLTGLSKDYTGVIRLGAFSSTYDAEGSIVAQSLPLPGDERMIEAAMRRQVGWRSQLAPPFSAVKVRGKKLYEYARQGQEVPQRARRVQISSFDLVEYVEPEVRFSARVGSGTYIRAMAQDLGVELQCGAYLASLRRERVGNFSVADAPKLAEFVKIPDLVGERMLGLAEALIHMPKITIAPQIEQSVLNGRGFTTRDILACETIPKPAETSVVMNSQGKVLSIVRGEPVAKNSKNREEESAANGDLYFRPVRVLGRE